jgi:hypothetical protein
MDNLPPIPDWLRNWCALEGYDIVPDQPNYCWRLMPPGVPHSGLQLGALSVMDEDWRPTLVCWPSWTLEIFLRSGVYR